MINAGDVIRLKIPFPDINATLAKQAHMYICCFKEADSKHTRKFVKCQTLKPYMLQNDDIKHFIDEMPDVSRNPFLYTTRIDCDKHFRTEYLLFDIALRTTIRADICAELMAEIIDTMQIFIPKEYTLNKAELLQINPLVKEITQAGR